MNNLFPSTHGAIMRLENWSVQWSASSDFIDLPELRTPVLHGVVFGSPHFKDGTPIRTSSIKGKRGEVVVTVTGHEYELGAVHPQYEAFCPCAREDVFRKLNELEVHP